MSRAVSNRGVWNDAIAWLFIFLWAYAASAKLLDHQKFSVQLGQSPLLMPVAAFASWFVPFAEAVIAIFLFVPRYRLAGFYLSFGLMVAFTAYIVAITRYSDYVPCSCGGILQSMSWDEHLVFNISFVILAMTGVLTTAGARKDILLQQDQGFPKT